MSPLPGRAGSLLADPTKGNGLLPVLPSRWWRRPRRRCWRDRAVMIQGWPGAKVWRWLRFYVGASRLIRLWRARCTPDLRSRCLRRRKRFLCRLFRRRSRTQWRLMTPPREIWGVCSASNENEPGCSPGFLGRVGPDKLSIFPSLSHLIITI